MNITATDIPDAWFQCLWNLFDVGHRYIIDKGSNEGQTRFEYEWISIKILDAYKARYDLMLPEIPSHIGIPNPVESGYVEEYIPYLMTSVIKKDEEYTYGSRLGRFVSYYDSKKEINIYGNQIDFWINQLKKFPNTNQAILQVAEPSDCLLKDPPCLRHIDMRVKDGNLHFYPYFRSWDLWGGFPANLAGIAVLQKYMADEIGVESGYILASSKGLHLYGYAEELARIRTLKEMKD